MVEGAERTTLSEVLWGWEWVLSDWVVREGFPEEAAVKLRPQ